MTGMKNKADKLYKLLKIIFWINILVVCGVTLFMLQIKGPDFGENVQSNVLFERYSIILTLIAVPLALKLFSVLVNRKKDLHGNDFLNSYLWIYVLRTAILDIAAVVNIVGFFIYEASNFVYLTVVVLFALCFTFPGKDIMPNDDDINKENINILN